MNGQIGGAGQEHAERHGYKRLLIQRRLEEGRAFGLLRNEVAGLAALKDAAAQAMIAEDDAMQFYAHYHLWKAYARTGDVERAAFELNTAQFLVRRVDEATPEASEIRKMVGASEGSASRAQRGRH